MNKRTEDLIGALSEGVVRVAALPPPAARAGRWLAFAVVLVGALVLWHGPRDDLAARFSETSFYVPWAASVAVAVAAAVAAFAMTVPGSPRWIAALPAAPLALWLGMLGTGCVRELANRGTAVLGTSYGCLEFIGLTSLPLGIVLIWMLRRGAPLMPAGTLAMGALAAASAGSAGLELFHHLQTSTMVLIWHLGTVALVALVGLATGPRALALPSVNRP
ncbi:MAG: DUF1109 family protein [Rhodospirillales bacterium]|nr:DUF1109 family protein [Rhodospirillales bacterium]